MCALPCKSLHAVITFEGQSKQWQKPFMENNPSTVVYNINGHSLQDLLSPNPACFSPNSTVAASFILCALQKTFPRTKQGHLSNVQVLYHRHPFIDSMFSFFRHNNFFPDFNLPPSHFFKLFSCHALLALYFSA